MKDSIDLIKQLTDLWVELAQCLGVNICKNGQFPA
jgi:hypothetical protein